MRTITLALVFAFIGVLTMLQQGDQDMLINERPALAVVCFVSILSSIIVMLADTFEVSLKRSVR